MIVFLNLFLSVCPHLSLISFLAESLTLNDVSCFYNSPLQTHYYPPSTYKYEGALRLQVMTFEASLPKLPCPSLSVCQRHGTSEADRRTLLLSGRDGIGCPPRSHCPVLEDKRTFTCVRQCNLLTRRGGHDCHLCAPFRQEFFIPLRICEPAPQLLGDESMRVAFGLDGSEFLYTFREHVDRETRVMRFLAIRRQKFTHGPIEKPVGGGVKPEDQNLVDQASQYAGIIVKILELLALVSRIVIFLLENATVVLPRCSGFFHMVGNGGLAIFVVQKAVNFHCLRVNFLLFPIPRLTEFDRVIVIYVVYTT
eukprot:02757_6